MIKIINMKNLLLFLSVLISSVSFSQLPSYVPANGLVGWWPFSGNANDASGNGNNGTVNGATLTSDRFGNVNSAYSFDGVDDFNEIDVNSYLQNGLTISVWIVTNLPNAQFTHKGIVWTRLSGPQGNPPFQPNQTTGLMIHPDGLLCNASDGYSNGVSLQDSGNYYNDNSWNHLVFSYDVITGLTRITINGNETVSLNSISLSNIDLAYNTIKIGKDEIVGYGNRHWYGKIDDIGIWNRALTPTEITALYTGTPPCTLSLGADLTVCGTSTTLTAPTGFDSYLWSNGATTNTTTVSASGTYSCTVTQGGCSASDTVDVTLVPNTTNTTDVNTYLSYTWPNTGQTYLTSGTYTGTTANCVTEVLNLTLTSPQLQTNLEWLCSSDTSADFQIRVTNIGSTQVKFNSIIVRGIHPPGLMVGAGVFSWKALNDNIIPNWLGWPNNYNNLPYTVATRQLNFSSSVQIFTNATAPIIPSGAGVVVGTFRIFTSTSWIPNSDFGFVFNPNAAVVGYIPSQPTTISIVAIGGGSSTTSCATCLVHEVSPTLPLNLTGPSTQAIHNFCGTASVADLIANPLYISPQVAEILWYTSSTGGSPLASSTPLTSGLYYASQLVNNCESSTRSVTVVTVTPNTTTTTPISACDSYTWANTGQTYTASGNYIGLTANCETQSLDLIITPSSTNTTPISACGTYTWANTGQTYTASGNYIGLTANCETQSLDLTITPSSTNTTPISACDSYTWANTGQTYTSSGIYTGSTTNCETQSLDLIITPSSTNTTPISTCDSYTWANTGQTYTSSGIYSGTTADCETQSLDLTITPSSTTTTPISACGTYTWANTGQTYTSSGIYTGSTTNCVTESLNLTITPNSTNTTPISVCDSYTWANTGQTYTTSGIYTGTTANCVTESLNLIITPSSTNTVAVSACGSYTWPNTNLNYTVSGIYTGSTTACVSQSLNLLITPSTSVTTTVTAIDSYTWPINSVTYTLSGLYNGPTINCETQYLNLTINSSSISEEELNQFSLYPNPASTVLNVSCSNQEGKEYFIFDNFGSIVKKGFLENTITEISILELSTGLYYFRVEGLKPQKFSIIN